MKSSAIINQLAKYATILILIILFIYGIYWLWQRQPKSNNPQPSPTTTGQTKDEKNQQDFKLTPNDFSVLTSKKVKFEGTVTPNVYFLIFSNSSQSIGKSDSNGNFQTETDLVDGLNLVSVATVSSNFQIKNPKSLTFLVAKDKNDGDTVFAGSVKTIFDTLITISTLGSQKSIQTSKSTKINLPVDKNEKAATGSALENIRIGDYLIVQGGSQKENELSAKKIDVIRENKPQNTKQLILAKILTATRQNLFSAKDQNSKIFEFTIGKNSQISIDGKEAKSADIVKDKNAIIVYHPENDKNIVDLVYLIP